MPLASKLARETQPQIFASTRAQRCWKHKNRVLNKLPQAWQAKAKANLNQISLAESRAAAEQAFDYFLLSYERSSRRLLSVWPKIEIFDFPAEHWQHIRTTNPIESTFSTVGLRTIKTRGCVSRAGMLAMVFKLDKDRRTKLALA